MIDIDTEMDARAPERALLVLCTVPAIGEHADRLARGLVEAGLAACVNVLGPIRSVYRWEGAVHHDDELQLVIKTRESRFEEVERFLTSRHPYEVPEVLALPVARGSSSYLDWLHAQTG